MNSKYQKLWDKVWKMFDTGSYDPSDVYTFVSNLIKELEDKIQFQEEVANGLRQDIIDLEEACSGLEEECILCKSN